MSGRPVYIHSIALKDQGGTSFCKVRVLSSSESHLQIITRDLTSSFTACCGVYMKVKSIPLSLYSAPLPVATCLPYADIKIINKTSKIICKIKRGHVTQTFNLLSAGASSRKPSTNSLLN